MTDHVIFLVFGIDEVFIELDYFFTRYLATRDPSTGLGPTFVVYTDRPDAFARWEDTDLRIETVDTPLSKIEEWTGPKSYFWRAKLMMIRDFCQRFDGVGLYCDSDVYPLRDLDPLFRSIEAGALIMYESEGVFDKGVNPEFWHLDKRFRAHPQLDVDGRLYHIPLSTQNWNAGVIGLSTENAPVLDEVLAFCDALYDEWGFVFCEQISMGYIFQNQPQGCSPAREYLYHYWRVRNFSLLARRFFELHEGMATEQVVRDSANILPELLAPHQHAFNDARPFQYLWNRYPYRMSKIFKRQAFWNIEDHYSLAEPLTQSRD